MSTLVTQVFKPGKRYDVYAGAWGANDWYRYSVELWTYVNFPDLKGWVFAGYGRYCHDMDEVRAYIDGATVS